MDLSTAINYALEGEALLFAGSGFSYGAKNINKTSFSAGDNLRDAIAKDCGLTVPRPLSVVSEYYVAEKSQNELISLLKKEFTVLSIASWHTKLLSVQWKRIYTTNYDSVIEIAAQTNAKTQSTVVLSDKISDYDINNVCVHLNGHIDHLNKDTINNEFKLTDGSYSCDTLEGNEWFELFKGDLQTAKAVVIIGYSMQFDIDIKRLLSTPAVTNKVLFIDKPSPDKVDKRLLERYGKCEFVGIEEFANNVEAYQRIYKPILHPETYQSFIHEYRRTLTPTVVTFKDLNDFFKKGKFMDSLMQKKYGNYQYMILRNAVDIVLRNFLNTKVFLALSDLGNGKTMFCHLVRNELREHEVDVFQFSHEYNDVEREIEQITIKRNRHCVVIIDDYKSKINILKRFKYANTDKITFILTSRKSLNPSYRVLINALGITESNIKPLFLDVLKDNEVEALSELITINKLYSSNMSDRTASGIRDYIQNACHSRFADLLLDFYNSSDIKERISLVWEKGLDEVLPCKRLSILALMKSVMGIDFNFTDMLNLLKIDYASLPAQESPFLKEFFDFDNDDIIIKSSIISRELLRSVVGISDLLETMKAVVIEANKEYMVNGNYFELLKNLVSHSHFRIFQATPENQAAITSFYDSIRNLSFCNDNTFFWEQFASACIETKDFTAANQCIENAFAIAKGNPRFVPFYIENIKANYLIEKILFDINCGMRPSTSDAIDIIVDCHNRLMKHYNHPDNNVSYIFRVGSKYAKLYERYKDAFDKRQKSIFTEKTTEMLKLMKKHQSDLEYTDHPLEKWIGSLESCL